MKNDSPQVKDIQPVLHVSNLKVVLEGNIIFQDVNFSLKQDETLVILGPNGSGKTVLLKALLGLLPHQGEIVWKKNVNVGYVPQRVPLNKDIPVTVEDFFMLQESSRHAVLEVLHQVGISEETFLQKQLGLLSSGQFQRVLIAWALIKNPDILLFDEPTAGIDIGGEETIHDLLQKTQQEKHLAIILVTHDLSIVYSRATHVLCLGHKKVCYGLPDTVLDPETLREIYGTEVKYFRHTNE